MADLAGATLGQYEIIELQGEGGMATVYKAWQPALQRYVALKVLASDLSGAADFVARFQQEAVAAANLRHNNIVTIYDVGSEQGCHYIAMEFIAGTSLKERIDAGGPLALEQVVDMITQVGEALDYAHQRGFIHRDIKPANVLIEQTGRVVLTDFGLVEALGSGDVTPASIKEGSIFGTPHYMSPEQIRGEPLDPRSDLYSLGVVCYEMLSGEVPFDGSTRSILYAHTHTPPPRLREVASAGVSPPLEAVVNKVLAKRPADRFSSVGQFVTAFSQAAAGVWPEGVHAGTAIPEQKGGDTAAQKTRHRAKPSQSQSAPARRSRWALFLGVVALGVAVIVGAVLLPDRGDALAETLDEAQAALGDANYRKAIDEFGRVLADDPDNVAALEGQLQAAAGLEQAGQLDAAIAAYKTVWQGRPGDIQTLRGLGQAYAAKEDWGRAAGWYEKWAQVAPQDSDAFLALANARFYQSEYVTALAAYERAEELGADAAKLDRNLGLAYYELAQYERAVERLQNTIGKNSEDFSSQRALGLSLYRLGHLEQAVEHLKEAIGLGAGRSGDELKDVYSELGRYFSGEQDYEQAIIYFEQAQELEPEAQAAGADDTRADLDQAYVENAKKSVLLDLDFSNIVTAGDGIYAVARTGQKIKIEGAVHRVEGPWEESQALVVEEETTNLVRNPILLASTFGYDFSQWDGSFSDGGDNPRGPGRILRYTHTSSTNKHAQVFWNGPLPTQISGATYAVQYWARSNAKRSVQVFVQKRSSPYDRASNVVKRIVGTDWAFVSAVLVLNKGIDDDYTIKLVSDTGWTDNVDWIEMVEVQVEEKDHVTSFCHGDAGDGCSWGANGPHSSASTRQATTVILDDYIGLISGKSRLSFRMVVLVAYDAAVDDSPSIWPLFDVGDGTPENRIIFFYYPGDDKFHLRINKNGVGHQEAVSPAQTFSAGDWLDLVVTIDFDHNIASIYRDGEKIVSNMNIVHDLPSLTEWSVGADRSGGTFSGLAFAEFAVFDRVFTPREVAALFRVDIER